jgi:hypothetical protein
VWRYGGVTDGLESIIALKIQSTTLPLTGGLPATSTLVPDGSEAPGIIRDWGNEVRSNHLGNCPRLHDDNVEHLSPDHMDLMSVGKAWSMTSVTSTLCCDHLVRWIFSPAESRFSDFRLPPGTPSATAFLRTARMATFSTRFSPALTTAALRLRCDAEPALMMSRSC